MDSVTGASPRQLARTAGALYLVNIVFGAFAIGLVPALLLVPDLAATARRLAALDACFTLVATAIEAAGLLHQFTPLLLLGSVDGLAYLVYGFSGLLAPGFAAHLNPWIQLPAPLGEGSLCLWLLVAGVNAERWKARARGSEPGMRLPARQ